jgi:hypothetical protein
MASFEVFRRRGQADMLKKQYSLIMQRFSGVVVYYNNWKKGGVFIGRSAVVEFCRDWLQLLKNGLLEWSFEGCGSKSRYWK